MQIRGLWHHYFQNTDAIIFVVDSADPDRIESEAQEELWKALNDQNLANVPLLVYANKQDLPNALSVQQVAQRLELGKIRNREWFVQACAAVKRDGIYEGLDWLAETLQKRRKNQA